MSPRRAGRPFYVRSTGGSACPPRYDPNSRITAIERSTARSADAESDGFAALGVSPRLVDALAKAGITDPFPIQRATLPDSLAGRDVLGRGRTGSGKTYAFAVPVLARLVPRAAPASAGRPARADPRSDP